MTADPGLVSVIIPVYNGESYLSEAVESVYAQTIRPLEVIVIDDGSTDGSAAVARSFEDVRFYRQPNRGAADARNRGTELAHGSFLAFLDADDVWTPQKLRIQMAALLEKAGTGYGLRPGRAVLEPGTWRCPAFRPCRPVHERPARGRPADPAGFFPSSGVVSFRFDVGRIHRLVCQGHGPGTETDCATRGRHETTVACQQSHAPAYECARRLSARSQDRGKTASRRAAQVMP